MFIKNNVKWKMLFTAIMHEHEKADIIDDTSGGGGGGTNLFDFLEHKDTSHLTRNNNWILSLKTLTRN
jgi:hypothetical protein